MMSDEEICRRYRTAKNRWEMTEILAQLNMMKRIDILEILLENGEDIVKPMKRKDGKPVKKGREYYEKLQVRLDHIESTIAKYESEYREIALLIKAGKEAGGMG